MKAIKQCVQVALFIFQDGVVLALKCQCGSDPYRPNAVEPCYKVGQRGWQNMFVTTRFRCIKLLFHIFYYYLFVIARTLCRGSPLYVTFKWGLQSSICATGPRQCYDTRNMFAPGLRTITQTFQRGANHCPSFGATEAQVLSKCHFKIEKRNAAGY